MDHCASNPCYNGECVSSGASTGFRCECDAGFRYINININNIYLNLFHLFIIVLFPFRGPDCRIDVNECHDSPCYYGKCVNTRGSYRSVRCNHYDLLWTAYLGGKLKILVHEDCLFFLKFVNVKVGMHMDHLSLRYDIDINNFMVSHMAHVECNRPVPTQNC